MTNVTKFIIPSFSTFFSWNTAQQRQVSTRNFLEMDPGLPQKELGAATELTHFEDENPHHLSYTSLRDVMTTSRPLSPIKRKLRESPTKEKEEDDLFLAGDRLPIKNRLVEQAARAYLLPSCAQRTPSTQFLARSWARLTSSLPSLHDVRPPAPRGCARGGCIHGCLCCLPSLLWLDLTRAFRSLFSHLRPQSFLRI